MHDLIPAIIECVAEADGVDPDELDYRLHDYIDPDILRKVESRTDTSVTVSFQVPNHTVTVTANGTISIDGTVYRNGRESVSETLPFLDQDRKQGPHWLPNLLSQLPGAVYRCRNEPEWPIDYISDGCREITGYDPTAFVVGGVSYGRDVIHPDDRETVRNHIQDALQRNEPYSHTYRIRTKDGTQKQVWADGKGIYEGGEAVAIVGYVTEIKKSRISRELSETA